MADKKTVPGADFIKEEIKRGLHGVYFFYGDEDYLKQYYLHAIEEKTVGSRQSMNFTRLTNDEFSADALEEALSAPAIPDFMSMAEGADSRRLVELYEIAFKSLKPSELTKTIKLLKEKPDEDTVVVIYSTAAELPEDSKPHKTIINELSKASKPVCFPFETDARLCAWMIKMAAKSKVALEPDLGRRLIERLGHNMLVLKNELEKLIAYALSEQRYTIVREDMEKVCVSNKEISPFDFSNALMRRDAGAAFYIFEDMKTSGVEPVIILSILSRVILDLIRVRGCMDKSMTRSEAARICSMHEYKVKLYMEALKDTDSAKLNKIAEAAAKADSELKSTYSDGYALIEKLICELCM